MNMNRHILSYTALAAMAAGAVWATSLPLDKSDKSEKQRPDEEILAKKVINRAHYAKMKTDGNDNGAPYGLTLRSVDNKQDIVSTVSVLVVYADQVPAAISLVINSAFNATAASGGFAGATVMLAMRSGVARGIFSNEAGLGSAPIVAAAAKTKWPAEQGLVSMTGTFIDTIIICTMTGLCIVVTGAWNGELNGAAMTEAAFASAFPMMAKYMLCTGLTLFAFTTIIGWNYYGERCVEYLFGVKGIKPYRYIYILLVASGAFLKLEMIWIIADIVNGLMAIPNLVALLGLSGVVVAETKSYFAHWERVHERKRNIAQAAELAAENE